MICFKDQIPGHREWFMPNIHVKANGVQVDLLPHLFFHNSSGKLVLGTLRAQSPA